MTAIAKRDFKSAIQGLAPKLEDVATRYLTPERLIRIFLAKADSKLHQCTVASIATALMEATQAGLEPNTKAGLAYILPYGQTATFSVGYKGHTHAMLRTGLVSTIIANVFTQDELDSGKLKIRIWPVQFEHDWTNIDRNEQNIAGAYCFVQLKDGREFIETVTRAEIDHRRSISRGANGPAWTKHFARMARKCAITKLATGGTLPFDAEDQNALNVIGNSDLDDWPTAPASTAATRSMDAFRPTGLIDAEVVDATPGPAPATPARPALPPAVEADLGEPAPADVIDGLAADVIKMINKTFGKRYKIRSNRRLFVALLEAGHGPDAIRRVAAWALAQFDSDQWRRNGLGLPSILEPAAFASWRQQRREALESPQEPAGEPIAPGVPTPPAKPEVPPEAPQGSSEGGSWTEALRRIDDYTQRHGIGWPTVVECAVEDLGLTSAYDDWTAEQCDEIYQRLGGRL